MLTESRVEDIFRELDSYVFELVEDPTSLGPQYFRDGIAVCRNHLNRVSLILSEIDRDRLAVASELRRKEALFAVDYDNKLANDPVVRALSSIDDRKATVNFQLRDLRVEINELKDRHGVLDAVYKAVLFRNRELQATMTALKDQKRVMQDEIRSGSFYGDERAQPPVEDEISADDLARLMSDDEPAGSADEAGVEPEQKGAKRAVHLAALDTDIEFSL